MIALVWVACPGKKEGGERSGKYGKRSCRGGGKGAKAGQGGGSGAVATLARMKTV